MFIYPNFLTRPRPERSLWLIFVISIVSASGFAQTAATGAAIGIVLDPSGAVVPRRFDSNLKESGGVSQSTSSDENGRFAIELLPPGTYQLQASRTDFKTLLVSDLHIYVTGDPSPRTSSAARSPCRALPGFLKLRDAPNQ